MKWKLALLLPKCQLLVMATRFSVQAHSLKKLRFLSTTRDYSTNWIFMFNVDHDKY